MTGDRISLPCAPDPFPALAKATPRERGFLDAFLWGPDKVAVLVRKTGLHPEATLPNGTTTGKEPHVLVQIGGGLMHGVPYYADFTVSAELEFGPSRGVAGQLDQGVESGGRHCLGVRCEP
jgi:hypothetical protein